MYSGLHVKSLLFLSDFNETSVLSTDILKNTQISNFMKIGPTRAKLFHADGRIDRHDVAIRLFLQYFANATNNIRIQHLHLEGSVCTESIVTMGTKCQPFSFEEILLSQDIWIQI
jgi:hypothetical protein